MTKAEEAALKAYPVKGEWVGNQYGEWDADINRFPRTNFQQGYEQAEKDIGWISVKDRLPETPTFVFTCIKYDGVPDSLGINFYENGKWWGGIDEEFNWPIEYWMPIPKLPKK